MLSNLKPTREMPWRFVFEPRLAYNSILPPSFRTTMFILVSRDETRRWAISSRWAIGNFVRKPHRNECPPIVERIERTAVDIYDRNDDVHVRVSLSELGLSGLWDPRPKTGPEMRRIFCSAPTSPGKGVSKRRPVDSTEYLLDRPGPSEKTPGPRS